MAPDQQNSAGSRSKRFVCQTNDVDDENATLGLTWPACR